MTLDGGASPLPSLHQEFLDRAIPRIAADPRVTAIALSGSLAHGSPDEFSDVDLVVAVRDADHAAVMAERLALIASWFDPVVGFTGEHVGEPRLIVTLSGPPALHVDVTFLAESDFAAPCAAHRLTRTCQLLEVAGWRRGRRRFASESTPSIAGISDARML